MARSAWRSKKTLGTALAALMSPGETCLVQSHSDTEYRLDPPLCRATEIDIVGLDSARLFFF